MSNVRSDENAFSKKVGEAKGMKPEEQKIYDQLIEWLRNAERSTPETEYRKEAAEDLDFYAGEQDSTEVLQALAEQRRPVEVYNEVKPKIDMLVGLAAQVRQDMQVVPVGTEDEMLAEVMNGVIKHFRNTLDLKSLEMDAFEHVAKAGRGLIQLYVDAENPFKPQIKVKFHRGHRFFVDPDFMEYDLSDARYVFVDMWLTEDDITQLFPNFQGEEVKAFGLHASSEYPIFWNEAIEKYRIVEGWYRKLEPVFWMISPFTGKPEAVRKKDWPKFERSIEELNEAIAAGDDPLQDGRGPEDLIEMPNPVPGFKKFTYFAIFSGNGILAHGENTYWHEEFPFSFIGAYRNDNKNYWFSAVKAMKDPQRALNTMRRQLVHLLQTAPKGIFMHESGAVLNIEEYEKRSADPTFHMELSRDGLGRVQFSNQPTISPLYGQLDGTFVQSMKDSSGIQDSLMGVQTTSREPGVTVRMRQETGLAVLYVLFRNFHRTRKLLTKQLMYLIKQYIDEPTVIRMEGAKGAELLQINTDANPQSPSFNDISLGEYDLYVEESVESSTMRMATAQWLTDYAMNNPGLIPPDVILEYSNIPFTTKQQVKQYHQGVQEQQAQAAQAEQAFRQRELDIKEMEAMAKVAAAKAKAEVDEVKAEADMIKAKAALAKPKEAAKPKPDK